MKDPSNYWLHIVLYAVEKQLFLFFFFLINSFCCLTCFTCLLSKCGRKYKNPIPTVDTDFRVHRLFSSPLPLEFWTKRLYWHGFYCKKHIRIIQARLVCLEFGLTVYECVFSTTQTCHRDRGGEFDISKLNSAQTWQWRSAVHSRRDCLYLRSCLWVLQLAGPLHRPLSPGPRQLTY